MARIKYQIVEQIGCVGIALSGVYSSSLLNDLEFYLGQILSLYKAKSLGKYLTPIFSFTKGQYLAQIKIQKIALLLHSSSLSLRWGPKRSKTLK